jgi:hypothetical protein
MVHITKSHMPFLGIRSTVAVTVVAAKPSINYRRGAEEKASNHIR